MFHKGKSEEAYQISMGIRAMTVNYVNTHSCSAKRENRACSRPPMGSAKLFSGMTKGISWLEEIGRCIGVRMF